MCGCTGLGTRCAVDSSAGFPVIPLHNPYSLLCLLSLFALLLVILLWSILIYICCTLQLSFLAVPWVVQELELLVVSVAAVLKYPCTYHHLFDLSTVIHQYCLCSHVVLQWGPAGFEINGPSCIWISGRGLSILINDFSDICLCHFWSVFSFFFFFFFFFHWHFFPRLSSPFTSLFSRNSLPVFLITDRVPCDIFTPSPYLPPSPLLRFSPPHINQSANLDFSCHCL